MCVSVHHVCVSRKQNKTFISSMNTLVQAGIQLIPMCIPLQTITHHHPHTLSSLHTPHHHSTHLTITPHTSPSLHTPHHHSTHLAITPLTSPSLHTPHHHSTHLTIIPHTSPSPTHLTITPHTSPSLHTPHHHSTHLTITPHTSPRSFAPIILISPMTPVRVTVPNALLAIATHRCCAFTL